ncbi:MAG: hypothetical protein IJ795_03370 [Bacteroidales bacterium]|nr:hypothetical protein [Bacteroidales bacterium]
MKKTSMIISIALCTLSCSQYIENPNPVSSNWLETQAAVLETVTLLTPLSVVERALVVSAMPDGSSRTINSREGDECYSVLIGRYETNGKKLDEDGAIWKVRVTPLEEDVLEVRCEGNGTYVLEYEGDLGYCSESFEEDAVLKYRFVLTRKMLAAGFEDVVNLSGSVIESRDYSYAVSVKDMQAKKISFDFENTLVWSGSLQGEFTMNTMHGDTVLDFCTRVY